MPNTRRLLLVLLTLVAAIAVQPAAGLAAPVVGEPPQLSFEPGSYDFGLQPVNSNAAQTTLQLRNTGTEATQINLDMVGPGTESFWIGNSNCYGTTLQPNETCSVQVNFSPRDMTEYSVQVRAGVNGYFFTAELTGAGGRSIFSPASNPTDFGAAAVGSAGVTREIAVTNVGNLPGGVFIAVVSGGAVGSFHLLDENCTGHPLAPAATCTLQVRFQPLSEGVKTATLSLFGESDGGTQVAITGVGTAPEPNPNLPTLNAPGTATTGGAANPVPDPAARPKPRHRKHKPRPRFQRRARRQAIDDGRFVARVG